MTDARPHLGLCLRNREPGWLSLLRDGDGWRGTGINSSLEGVIPPLLRQVGINPMAGFTFSGARRAEQVMADLVEEQPTAEALKAMLPGFSISVLCPVESPHYPNLWANIWRDPRGGLTTHKRFSDSALLDQIEAYFDFYTLAKIQSGRAGALELWVRRGWRASGLLPEAFPAPKGHPKTFLDAKAAYDAHKSKKRKGKPAPAAQAAE